MLTRSKNALFWLPTVKTTGIRKGRFQVEEGVSGFLGNLSPKVLVLREFFELSELPIHFSNAIDPTNTQGMRMAGVAGRKGAYGAHIFNIAG